MNNLTDKNNPIIFKLPYTINFSDQLKLIEYAYKYANSWSGQVQFWDKKSSTYDPGNTYFGRVQIRGISNSPSSVSHPEQNKISSNWLNWAHRLDDSADWEYIETPVTGIVKDLMSNISHLYKKVTRILLLVQNPNEDIPLHTDKVLKNQYDNELFQPGPTEYLNKISYSNLHEQNRYMALKFPLSEIYSDNGKPIVKIDDKIYRYDVSNHLFAINEVQIEHGAIGVEHRRGVIFIDGLIDWENLIKEKWIPVPLIEC
jgi:hypothetical protein